MDTPIKRVNSIALGKTCNLSRGPSKDQKMTEKGLPKSFQRKSQ